MTELTARPRGASAAVITAATLMHYALPDYCRSRPGRTLIKIAVNGGALLAVSRLEPEEWAKMTGEVRRTWSHSTEARTALATVGVLSAAAAAGTESLLFRRGERRRLADRRAHTKQAMVLAAAGALTMLGLPGQS